MFRDEITNLLRGGSIRPVEGRLDATGEVTEVLRVASLPSVIAIRGEAIRQRYVLVTILKIPRIGLKFPIKNSKTHKSKNFMCRKMASSLPSSKSKKETSAIGTFL